MRCASVTGVGEKTRLQMERGRPKGSKTSTWNVFPVARKILSPVAVAVILRAKGGWLCKIAFPTCFV